MNIYFLLAILTILGFIAWRFYHAGAKSKSVEIERDSLEETLGVEHAIQENLIEERKKQREKMDILDNFESARNIWLRNNSDSPDPPNS